MAIAAALLWLAACSAEPEESATAAAPASQLPPDWPGRWNGPEGTYLDITAQAGVYRVTISNLDGPVTYPATPVPAGLSFERDGVRETLRATDGAGTGMKWLADRRRCLTVKPGEGFCRE